MNYGGINLAQILGQMNGNVVIGAMMIVAGIAFLIYGFATRGKK